MTELSTNSETQEYNVDDMANISSSEAAAALAGMRKTYGGGRPAVKRKCTYCKLQFTAREMMTHQPTCKALHNPTDEPRAGRPLGWRKLAKPKAKARAKKKG